MSEMIWDDQLLKKITGTYAEALGSAVIEEFGSGFGDSASKAHASEILEKIMASGGSSKIEKIAVPGDSNKTGRIRPAYSILKKVAAVILVLGLSAGMVFTFSEDARAAVVKWYRNVIGDHIVYHFDVAEDSGALKDEKVMFDNIALKWVPEGFEVKEEETEADEYRVYFENEEGQMIDFSCTSEESALYAELITPEDNLEKITTDKMEYDFYQTLDEDELSFLIWMDEEHKVFCVMGSSLGKEDMLKIAENIEFEGEKG